MSAAPVLANGLPIGGARAKLFQQQLKLLNGRLSQEYSGSDRLQPKTALPSYTGKYRGAYLQLARDCAQAAGVPVDLYLRLVQQESGWNQQAVSPRGARGLAQLMPQTARDLGIDINDPRENLRGGARYLRMMYDRYGSWK
ncbi:lytic transglycosylase domain-containing protein, partial [Thioclava sp. BHET1]